MEFPFGYLVKILTTTDITSLFLFFFVSVSFFLAPHLLTSPPPPYIFIRYTNPTSPLFKKVIRWFNLTQPLSYSFFFRGNYYSPSLGRNIHRSLSVLLPPYSGQEDPTPPSSSFICLPPISPNFKKSVHYSSRSMISPSTCKSRTYIISNTTLCSTHKKGITSRTYNIIKKRTTKWKRWQSKRVDWKVLLLLLFTITDLKERETPPL